MCVSLSWSHFGRARAVSGRASSWHEAKRSGGQLQEAQPNCHRRLSAGCGNLCPDHLQTVMETRIATAPVCQNISVIRVSPVRRGSFLRRMFMIHSMEVMDDTIKRTVQETWLSRTKGGDRCHQCPMRTVCARGLIRALPQHRTSRGERTSFSCKVDR